MGKFAVLGNELYQGRSPIDFVGRKWLWYSISAVILLIAIGGWTIKGLNFGIEFTGGSQYTVSVPPIRSNQDTADELREAIGTRGSRTPSSPDRDHPGDDAIVVQTEPLTDDESDRGRSDDRRTSRESTPRRHLAERDRRRAGARRSPSAR